MQTFVKKLLGFFQPNSNSDSNTKDSTKKTSTKKEDGSVKTGYIQFFNRAKGYGFIQLQNMDQRVFVHISDLKDRIKRGDNVKFVLEENEKGWIAKDVQLLGA